VGIDSHIRITQPRLTHNFNAIRPEKRITTTEEYGQGSGFYEVV
jgi:hypothetical protein